jgi:hypothetical protein
MPALTNPDDDIIIDRTLRGLANLSIRNAQCVSCSKKNLLLKEIFVNLSVFIECQSVSLGAATKEHSFADSVGH